MQLPLLLCLHIANINSITMQKLLFIFILLVHTFTIKLYAQINEKYFSSESIMPIGAYYYPEHWSSNQWERDLKRMASLGFGFTHFGEFAWAMMEPEEGKFEFDWLDSAIELANKYNLDVIMCTPTPTPPAWLTEKHPEILIVTETGTKLRHGTRLHVNGTHPVYKEYTKKIVEQLAQRYGNNPGIIGWQIDNEPHFRGLYDYSEHAQLSFREWLKNRYNSIEALNNAWGNAFWSMTYNNFEQIRIPNKQETQTVNPHALIDFQRFTYEALGSFLAFQAQILRDKISPSQFITTNYAYYKFLPSVNLFQNREDLDFASHTMYLLSTYLNYPEGKLAYRLGSGMELSFSAEFARSVNGATGIMELQPGQINWGTWNSQPLPGAVRMWIWHAFALGDEFVCTYRFRQPLYGGEQYHKGIMETDGITVSPGGKEYVQTITEIKSLDKNAYKIPVPNDYKSRITGFLWKQDNLLDLENTKHTASWDTWQHYYIYYLKLKSLGAKVVFLTENDPISPEKYPFLVAPAYEMVNQFIREKLEKYVKDGGHLILSCRSGMKDENGHLWEKLLQEPIWNLIGGKVEFNDQLPPNTNGKIIADDETFSWNVWAEILTPVKNQTEVLARYHDQFYKGKAAVMKHDLGKGSVTYIGVWSENGELEEKILRRTFLQSGADILDQPDYVFTEWREGYWITVNYSSNEIRVPVKENSKVIIGKEKIPPGDVCVWIN